MKFRTTVYEQSVRRLFYHVGRFVGRRPWQVIIVILSLTFVSAIGMVKFQENNNVKTEFTPRTAPSRTEYQVVRNFLRVKNQNGSVYLVTVIVTAKDGGSLLRPDEHVETMNLTTDLVHGLSISTDRFNKSLTFLDMCSPYCNANNALQSFLSAHSANVPSLTYPSLSIFGRRTFIGNNVFDVTIDNATGYVTSYRTVLLHFFLFNNNAESHMARRWERAAVELIVDSDKNRYPHLSVLINSDDLLANEVGKMGTELAPAVVVSFLSLLGFVVVTAFRYDAIDSRPIEAGLGAIVPLLALVTTVGLLSAVGLQFQSIVVATLFLVLAVGVDDVFIMLKAWDRSRCAASDGHSDGSLSSSVERLATALQESGPSITITSATNALSFAVGTTSDTPAVRTFCIYSSLSIVICYFYQLLLFSAMLVIGADRHCWCLTGRKLPVIQRLTSWHDAIICWWSSTVTKPATKLAILLLLVAYWTGALFGCRSMRTDISVQKLAMPDSYLIDYQQKLESTLAHMQSLAIFVLKPPDLRQSAQLHRLMAMIERFETAPYSYGRESTFFWLRPYQDYLAFYEFDGAITYRELPTFLQSASYDSWRSFLRLNDSACTNNQPTCIDSFLVSTGFTTVVKFYERIPVLAEWRQIASDYSDFDVFTYHESSLFTDQTSSIEITVMMTVLTALCGMSLVCTVFIPNWMNIVCAVSSVLSINFGVFGFLSLWSIDLDPLSMASLLMAIGFSVDFTAHISYHYHRNADHSPSQRVQMALLTVGWPTFQGGLSTLLGMMPILIRPSYLSFVFFKTVVSVVVFGLFHGLVVLPAMLTTLPNGGLRQSDDSLGNRRPKWTFVWQREVKRREMPIVRCR